MTHHKAKPIAGYPSRTDAVLSLGAAGLAPPAIAEQLGMPVKHVTALIASARRRVGRKAMRKEIVTALLPHAAARSLSVDELARRIVEHVVTDNLIAAVLDDGVHAPQEGTRA